MARHRSAGKNGAREGDGRDDGHVTGRRTEPTEGQNLRREDDDGRGRPASRRRRTWRAQSGVAAARCRARRDAGSDADAMTRTRPLEHKVHRGSNVEGRQDHHDHSAGRSATSSRSPITPNSGSSPEPRARLHAPSDPRTGESIYQAAEHRPRRAGPIAVHGPARLRDQGTASGR
jgi:hypothetical protein